MLFHQSSIELKHKQTFQLWKQWPILLSSHHPITSSTPLSSLPVLSRYWFQSSQEGQEKDENKYICVEPLQKQNMQRFTYYTKP